MAASIGIDMGTSSIKGAAVSTAGVVVAHASAPTVLDSPRPGWFELDPEQHYHSVARVITQLAAGCDEPVGAIAIAAASGNTVLLDQRDTPLCPAVSWMDRRARSLQQRTPAGLDREAVRPMVGWPYLDLFPLAHLWWYRSMAGDLLDSARRIAMNNDYVTWRLCGTWGIDHSTATTTYLQDQVAGEWHQPYLNAVGIERVALSALGHTGSVLDAVTSATAEQIGVGAQCVVVRGCFDHPAAARGCNVVREGEVLLSCGTSWVVLSPWETRERALSAGDLVDPFLAPSAPWAAMSSIPEAGRVIEELCRALYPDASPEERYTRFTAEMERGEPAAPETVPSLEAVLGALDSGDVAEIAHALGGDQMPRRLVETLGLRVRAELERLRSAGAEPERIVVVGGPAENRVLLRLLASVIGAPLEAGSGRYAGAEGAAWIAAGAVRGNEGRPTRRRQATEVAPDAAAARHYENVFRATVRR